MAAERVGKGYRVVPARLPEDVGAELLAGLGRLTACRALGEASLRDVCAALLSIDKAADVPDAAGAVAIFATLGSTAARRDAVAGLVRARAGILGDALSASAMILLRQHRTLDERHGETGGCAILRLDVPGADPVLVWDQPELRTGHLEPRSGETEDETRARVATFAERHAVRLAPLVALADEFDAWSASARALCQQIQLAAAGIVPSFAPPGQMSMD